MRYWLYRWLLRLYRRLGSLWDTERVRQVDRVSAQLERVHRVVQSVYPGTPWVCGGVWSWYSPSPALSLHPSPPNGDRCPPSGISVSDWYSPHQPVLFYHYLPLVVVFPFQGELAHRAQQLGVSVWVLSEDGSVDEDGLRSLLESMRGRALYPL